MSAACVLNATVALCNDLLVQLNASADVVVGVSLVAIGVALLFVVRRRPDLVLRRLRGLFAIIAILAGSARLLGVAGLLAPSATIRDVQSGLVVLLGLSAATAAAVIWRFIPRFLRLPSNSGLIQANQRLRDAEAATARANQWLTLSERIANVGHWRLCPRSLTMTWSDELYRIFGIPPQPGPLKARAINRAWHPDDRALVRRAALRALRDQADFDAEARIIRPNGQVRHILVRGLFHAPEDGGDNSLFGICLDRTEQKRIEQDLDHARAMAEQAMQRLEEQALQDSLTGLANRRRFDTALDAEFRRTKRLGLPLSLIMLDVDNFKAYNDAYGHPAGDECLRAIASEISRPLRRPGDLAARYGGEELAILMPGIPLAAAAIIAAKIVRAVRELAIEHEGSETGIVTISAGVATMVPRLDDADGFPLVRDADRALYDAKRGGRNRVCLFQAGAERMALKG